MTGILRVNIGEPAPWFAGPNAPGQSSSIVLDEFAGHAVVLFFYGSAAHSEVADVLTRLTGRSCLFEQTRSIFIGISNDPNDVALDQGEQSEYLRLFDLNGDVTRLYFSDFSEPAAFVLSPALQIVEIIELADPTKFIEQISTRLAQLNTAPRQQNAPVLIVPGVFDSELCVRLTNLYEVNGGREIGSIEFGGHQVQKFDPRFRKRRDWYISDEQTLQQVRILLERRLLPIVYRAFQFHVTRIERYLVGCYDAEDGGHFRPHRDNTAPVVSHRRFALSINLNDEYEGGTLRFPEFGYQSVHARPGDAIVFSCSLLHEVTPVTRNRRYAFLSFFYDEASERLREHNKTAWISAQART